MRWNFLWVDVLISFQLDAKKTGQPMRFTLLVTCPEPLLLYKTTTFVSVLLYLVLFDKHHSEYKNPNSLKICTFDFDSSSCVGNGKLSSSLLLFYSLVWTDKSHVKIGPNFSIEQLCCCGQVFTCHQKARVVYFKSGVFKLGAPRRLHRKKILQKI